jgi:hypothetical protein
MVGCIGDNMSLEREVTSCIMMLGEITTDKLKLDITSAARNGTLNLGDDDLEKILGLVDTTVKSSTLNGAERAQRLVSKFESEKPKTTKTRSTKRKTRG